MGNKLQELHGLTKLVSRQKYKKLHSTPFEIGIAQWSEAVVEVAEHGEVILSTGCILVVQGRSGRLPRGQQGHDSMDGFGAMDGQEGALVVLQTWPSSISA